jgi:putative ABC transport system permease protein
MPTNPCEDAMLSLYRTLSTHYFSRHKGRSLLVVFSIALGVIAWVFTSILIESMKREINLAATPLAGTADLYVSTGNGVPLALRDELVGVPGVVSVRPLIIEPAVLPGLQEDGHPQSVVILGVESPQSDAGTGSAWGIETEQRLPGDLRMLFTGKPAYIGEKLEAALGDQAAQFSLLVGGKTRRITRCGIVRASGPAATLGGNVIVMTLGDAAALRDRPGFASRFDIALEAEADRDTVREQLTAAIAGQALVSTPKDQQQRIHEVLIGLEIGFTIGGFMALVVGMFLVYITLAVSVTERRHEIGILRSLGATRPQILALFLGEAALLGLVGTLLGIAIGFVLAELSLGPMLRTLQDAFLPMHAEHIAFTNVGMTVASALAAGLAASLIAALIPSMLAATEEPADVVRQRAPGARVTLRLAHIAACGLLVGGGVALITCSNYLPRRLGVYAGPAVILLGCLLAAPILTSAIAYLLQPLTRRLFRVEARLAADNLLRAPARTGLVIGAVAAGVALMVQTAGLVRSCEHAMLAWIDESVRADAFITSGGPFSGSGQTVEMGEEVRRALNREFGAAPDFRVVAVCFRHLTWEHHGASVDVLLIACDAGAYHTAHVERGYHADHLDVFRRLAEEPDGVVASQNFLDKHDMKVGDVITLPGARGEVRLRILGSFVDYSWNMGTLFVDRAPHATAFNTHRVSIYDCYLPTADTDKEAFRRRVQQSSWGAEHALFVLTREELIDLIRSTLRRVYGLAYTQQFLVAVVVALGVMAALLISVIQRRRELGLLRAVGATRGQIMGTVVAEAVLMGAIGTLLGLVIDWPLVWYIIHVLLFYETGFVFPVVYPWLSAALVAGVAMLLAVLAAQIPALQAGRLHITEAIAYE